MDEKVKKLVDKIGYQKVIDNTGLTIEKVLSMLGKDLDDEETQVDIVKNFLYFNNLSEVLFIEVEKNNGEYIIRPHIAPETAANSNSWFDRYFCDDITKYVPFIVKPIWSKYNPECKIFISSETFESDEDDEDMSLQESIKRVLKEETQKISNEKLVEMFYSRLTKKGDLELHGLIIKPVYNENVLFFDIENPNDVSYSKHVIENYVDKLFNKFLKLFGLNRFKIRFPNDKYLVVNGEKVYLNKKDSQHIKKLITNVKRFKIEFNDFDLVGDIWYWSEVFYISANRDSIELNVEGQFKNYKKQYRNGDIVDIGIDEVDDILDGWDNNDVFTDYIQDKLYDDAMTYIWNLPALCDQDNDFISVGIKTR